GGDVRGRRHHPRLRGAGRGPGAAPSRARPGDGALLHLFGGRPARPAPARRALLRGAWLRERLPDVAARPDRPRRRLLGGRHPRRRRPAGSAGGVRMKLMIGAALLVGCAAGRAAVLPWASPGGPPATV